MEVRIYIGDERLPVYTASAEPALLDDGDSEEEQDRREYHVSLEYRRELLEQVRWDGSSRINWTVRLHDRIAELIEDGLAETSRKARSGIDAQVSRHAPVWYPQFVFTDFDRHPIEELSPRQWFLLFGYLEATPYDRERDDIAVFDLAPAREFDWCAEVIPTHESVADASVLGVRHSKVLPPAHRHHPGGTIRLPKWPCIVGRARWREESITVRHSLSFANGEQVGDNSCEHLVQRISVRGPPHNEVPDLVVKIVRRNNYIEWDIDVSRSVQQLCRLPSNTTETILLRGLEHQCNKDLRRLEATDAGLALQHIFESLGQNLYNRSPTCFKQAYWSIRHAMGLDFSIQLVCDATFIPWEYMWPVAPYERGDGTTIPIARPHVRSCALMHLHSIARKPHGIYAPNPSRIEGSKIILIVDSEISDGAIEAQEIITTCERQRILSVTSLPPVHADVLEFFHTNDDTDGDESTLAWIHFIGHGHFTDAHATKPTINLQGGEIETDTIRREQVVRGKSGAFVMLNSCRGIRQRLDFVAPSSWGEAFMERGFRGVVLTARAVDDFVARRFAVKLFESLLDGATLGEAMRASRSPAGDDSSLFYFYYGDVMAAFDRRRIRARDGDNDDSVIRVGESD